MAYLQPLLHLAQASLSGYSLFHAYISITNLQKYEKKTEKAAEWSRTAAQELHKTRTTQTSGTLAILSSLVVALGLTFKASSATFNTLFFNSINVAICYFAQNHIGNFWNGKAKVPFVQGYNDAITSTTIIRNHLQLLGVGWAISSVVELFRVVRG
ncbi:hypothetical protein EJ08DRAFT_647521 [Tothia fuscella]|uniref:Uncharacterized protein n=1 Tax=Tothia fuscella TaxID=1048955 RepID=A0A9P4U1P4_9PEZI|nr:hypothetical protein EJ08DRAFT_647521 [Tothia fuscella]